MSREVEAFLDASRYVGRVLANPAVGEAWHVPSVLARMDVGALTGHIYLVVRRVNKHLDGDRHDADVVSLSPLDGRLPTIRVDSEADLDAEVHVRVRTDAQRVAERGWTSVAGSFGQVVEALAVRLADPPFAILPLGGITPIVFAPYLASRAAELLVHADDLALSVGLDVEPPSAATVSIALDFLVETSRLVHGDLAVLRAFTRRERTLVGIPMVY